MKKKFRILHVGKFFPPYSGGVEKFFQDLVKFQKTQGHQVQALVHRYPFWKPSITIEKEGIHIHQVRCLGQMFYAPLAPSFPLHYLQILRSFRPEIIHLHLPNTSAFSALLFPTSGAKLVIHWHADVLPSRLDRSLALLYRFYRPLERALLKRADVIIATSPPYLKTSVPLAPFRSKTKVVPLGLDPSRLVMPSPKEQKELLKPLSPFVLSIGRFTYYKGFEYLLGAMNLLSQAKLCLVGHGKLKKFLCQKIKMLKLERRVFLLENLPDPKLNALLANCALFCLPSIERTEAFGLVLLEAMAFGRPLVTTSVEGSGMNWVNIHGETGLVVPPASSEALAQAMKTLLENPPLAREMGQRARERFEEKFHIEKIAGQIQEIYDAI